LRRREASLIFGPEKGDPILALLAAGLSGVARHGKAIFLAADNTSVIGVLSGLPLNRGGFIAAT
jgi:hypothetical protein